MEKWTQYCPKLTTFLIGYTLYHFYVWVPECECVGHCKRVDVPNFNRDSRIRFNTTFFSIKGTGLLTTNPIQYGIFTCNAISPAERCQHSLQGHRLCLNECIKFSPSKVTRKNPSCRAESHSIDFIHHHSMRQANVLGQKQFGHIKWPINVILHHILIENRCPQCQPLTHGKKHEHHILSFSFWWIVVWRTNKQKKWNSLAEAQFERA